ncbi:hypothetical protein CCACVL1_05505, partial [Corchorus capsularis]
VRDEHPEAYHLQEKFLAKVGTTE